MSAKGSGWTLWMGRRSFVPPLTRQEGVATRFPGKCGGGEDWAGRHLGGFPLVLLRHEVQVLRVLQRAPAAARAVMSADGNSASEGMGAGFRGPRGSWERRGVTSQRRRIPPARHPASTHQRPSATRYATRHPSRPRGKPGSRGSNCKRQKIPPDGSRACKLVRGALTVPPGCAISKVRDRGFAS